MKMSNPMTNTLYTGDNLYVLTGLNSESADLIYLDPPFNSKRTYSAPIGSKAAGSSFKDMWTWQDVDEAHLETLFDEYPALVRFIESIEIVHSKAMMAYITYMSQRILEMHRILKPTGSFYLHCDSTASHYLKIVLDRVFGKGNFRREVIWANGDQSGFKSKARNWIRGSDTILYYTKLPKGYTFNKEYFPLDEKTIKRYDKIDDDGRHYKVYEKGTPKERRTYLQIDRGSSVSSVWTDVPSFQKVNNTGEFLGYPTQKPLSLLERIIKASSNEGDVVLDPFCGCATTCVAAQRLNRKWIGIDIESKAAEVLIDRLSDDAGFFKDFIHDISVPQRTDVKKEAPSLDVKERLYKDQSGECVGCGTEYQQKDFEIDHIKPKSKGGGDYYDNYQLLCGHCNRTKGNRPMEYLIQKRRSLSAHTKTLTFGGKYDR